MNLYEETMQAIEEANQTIGTVKIVTTDKASCDWIDFANQARNYNYDDGYGSAEVIESLAIIFEDGTWLERYEYDGSEYWVYKRVPEIAPLGVVDLRSSWMFNPYRKNL